jgi:hypothetical protein
MKGMLMTHILKTTALDGRVVRGAWMSFSVLYAKPQTNTFKMFLTSFVQQIHWYRNYVRDWCAIQKLQE